MAPTLRDGFSCFSLGRLTEQKCRKAHLCVCVCVHVRIAYAQVAYNRINVVGWCVMNFVKHTFFTNFQCEILKTTVGPP